MQDLSFADLLRLGTRREDSRGLRAAFHRIPEVELHPHFRRVEVQAAVSGVDDFEEDAASALVGPIGDEPCAQLLPKAEPKPSDRAAHGRVLLRFLRAAQRIAAYESEEPLFHGRCCLVGLFVLLMMRLLAFCEGVLPGHVLFGIHWLTSSSDLVCLCAASPLYAQGTVGKCVQLGCIGPMVTMLFSMCLADVGALLAYLAFAAPQPRAAGEHAWLEVLRASVGSWEFVLFSSVALQLALCTCSWRIYRELRATGLYPPGMKPVGLEPIEDVSCLELVCEIDDARRAHRACHDGRASSLSVCENHWVDVTSVVVAIPSKETASRDSARLAENIAVRSLCENHWVATGPSKETAHGKPSLLA